MKTELRVKLLQYWIESIPREQGFTLLELLVVIMIIGLLSALALPSFLSQSSKARESEALTYIGSINRGQQAYFLEKNTFGNLDDLQVGLSSSKNYTYASTPVGAGSLAAAVTTATPAGVMRGYAGRVWLGVLTDGTLTSWSIVCQGTPATVPVVTGTVCP
ncbi:MAG: type IV pilin-like G/H family protein [Oculatellaceae cyanobacterium bins.114]|nr:type IV pilin-like G/H family protein [Oculatellaceae cyanobacterium bins.114]